MLATLGVVPCSGCGWSIPALTTEAVDCLREPEVLDCVREPVLDPSLGEPVGRPGTAPGTDPGKKAPGIAGKPGIPGISPGIIAPAF